MLSPVFFDGNGAPEEGMEPIALGLAESDAYVKREIARWADVVKLSGAKAD